MFVPHAQATLWTTYVSACRWTPVHITIRTWRPRSECSPRTKVKPNSNSLIGWTDPSRCRRLESCLDSSNISRNCCSMILHMHTGHFNGVKTRTSPTVLRSSQNTLTCLSDIYYSPYINLFRWLLHLSNHSDSFFEFYFSLFTYSHLGLLLLFLVLPRSATKVRNVQPLHIEASCTILEHCPPT